jgi:hypothetical protein
MIRVVLSLVVDSIDLSSRFLVSLNSRAALLDQLGNQTGPTGLVTRADFRPVVAVKIFVEVDEITPIWILLEFLKAAVD